MKLTTRVLMRSLKRAAVKAGGSRTERARHLLALRAIRGGRESLRQIHLASVRPCPACGRPHDVTRIPPPRVPLGIRCACCCQ
jgi:hypothetical protein